MPWVCSLCGRSPGLISNLQRGQRKRRKRSFWPSISGRKNFRKYRVRHVEVTTMHCGYGCVGRVHGEDCPSLGLTWTHSQPTYRHQTRAEAPHIHGAVTCMHTTPSRGRAEPGQWPQTTPTASTAPCLTPVLAMPHGLESTPSCSQHFGRPWHARSHRKSPSRSERPRRRSQPPPAAFLVL